MLRSDPCYQNEAECEEPHPFAVCTHPAPLPFDRRGCTNPPLPSPNWGPAVRGGPTTPAEDYPSVRDVCAAGTTAVIISTRDWLGQAHDYLAHGANDQAGLIAAELCAESSFQNLTCLRGGGGGGAGAGGISCADDPNWSSTFGPSFMCNTCENTRDTPRALQFCPGLDSCRLMGDRGSFRRRRREQPRLLQR